MILAHSREKTKLHFMFVIYVFMMCFYPYCFLSVFCFGCAFFLNCVLFGFVFYCRMASNGFKMAQDEGA